MLYSIYLFIPIPPPLFYLHLKPPYPTLPTLCYHVLYSRYLFIPLPPPLFYAPLYKHIHSIWIQCPTVYPIYSIYPISYKIIITTLTIPPPQQFNLCHPFLTILIYPRLPYIPPHPHHRHPHYIARMWLITTTITYLITFTQLEYDSMQAPISPPLPISNTSHYHHHHHHLLPSLS